MKLLICTQVVDTQDPILGFFHEWIRAFAHDATSVVVICLKKGVCELPPNVRVVSLGKEEGENRIKYLYRFYTTFFQVFVREHVDVVFYHMGALYNILGAPFFLVRFFTHTKFYWWKAHGHINWTGRIALCFVDRVYTSTESGFPIATPKRMVVGQAINESLFIPSSLPRVPEIIFVGRIAPIKRIEDFIDTAVILKRTEKALRFTIVGPIVDTQYYESLVSRIREKGMEESITIIPPLVGAPLRALYQSATILLNTSRTESMDKTVLEAMLSGCIPVTANRAFAHLLHAHGLYQENATPEIYARCISALLAQNQESLRNDIRKLVIQSHSLTTFSQRIFGVTPGARK
jgi:glycosyltransferase involved in cell wall biosynthesis